MSDAFLLQYLHPHEKIVQIEISSRMVEIGKRLQAWLGIPHERVEWVAGDVEPRQVAFVSELFSSAPECRVRHLRHVGGPVAARATIASGSYMLYARHGAGPEEAAFEATLAFST